MAVGDIMMGTNYPSSSSLPPNDGQYLFDEVSKLLRSPDVTIGNLEGTLLNSGGNPKQCAEPDNCISFRMPEHYAGYLKNAGFDIVSLANNHSGDMGDIGRKSTVTTLEKYEIKFAGYKNYPFTIFEKDGVKFGFAAFAPNTGTVSINNLKEAVSIVKELRGKCDILTISFHGGAEGSGSVRVLRAREYYLGEDRGNVYSFAHSMIDAGADIVIGHGPHVPRAVELYKDHLIAYSLGNFCTYSKFGLSGALGLAPILYVVTDKNGKFIKGKILSAKQVKGGIPVMDGNYQAAKLMADLSNKDFPESMLRIDDNGNIELLIDEDKKLIYPAGQSE